MKKAKKEKEEAKLQKSNNTPKRPRGRPGKKSQMKLDTEKESNTENCDEGKKNLH